MPRPHEYDRQDRDARYAADPRWGATKRPCPDARCAGTMTPGPSRTDTSGTQVVEWACGADPAHRIGVPVNPDDLAHSTGRGV